MAQVNLGRIGFVNKGSWNSVTNYKLNDVVKYGGSTYAAKRPNVGITPPTNGTDTDDWFYFVNNSDYVDKTSNQDIPGIKNFINGITTSKINGNPIVIDKMTFNVSPIVPTPTTNTEAANKAYVDSATDRIGLIDYGYVAKNYHVIAFGGEFNRANYPKLWAYLQANPSLVKTQAQWQTESTANGGICGFFSDGNGTTTFRVPNLDGSTPKLTNRGVGSYEADQVKQHRHTYTILGTEKISAGNSATVSNEHPETSYTSYFGGVENTVRNTAFLPLIVAK